MNDENTFEEQLFVYGPTGGIAGPQGTIGAQGTQGIVGQGIAGNQGLQGTDGAQGFLGAQGIQGLVGDGPPGVQGNQGEIGSQGAQGSSSSIGALLPESYIGGSTGSISFTIQGPPAYYELTAPFWQTGTTGTIVVTIAGVPQNSTTILQTFGIFKAYISSDGISSIKCDYELIGNTTAGTFQNATYNRYCWFGPISGPTTTFQVSGASFYYGAIKKFAYV